MLKPAEWDDKPAEQRDFRICEACDMLCRKTECVDWRMAQRIEHPAYASIIQVSKDLRTIVD